MSNQTDELRDEVSPRLDRIIGYSNWLKDDADGIAFNVRTMPRQPEFKTKAEDALKNAKARLQAALVEVDGALAEFAAKPVKSVPVTA